MYVAFGTAAKSSSDFYKKLQDGASIIPIEIKEETDTEDRDAKNNLCSMFGEGVASIYV